MKKYIVLIAAIVSACAHEPKCGGPAPAVYEDGKSCVARIRAVTIASEINIPQSLKDKAAHMRLEWTEPQLVDGRVIGGHFVLTPGGGK